MTDSYNSPQSDARACRKFLTFALAEVTYAVPVEMVKEIRGYSDVTVVPGAAHYVLGVMNLRGQVIPVMDLRARFGLPTTERNRTTVIILLSLGTRIVGVVVDAVSDVMDIPVDDINPVPELGETVDQRYLAGMATVDTGLVLTLCVEAIVGSEGLADAGRAA